MTSTWRGERFVAEDGTEGVATGPVATCQMHGCTGVRVYVRWEDGRTTRPCSKGLEYDRKTERWKAR